jgi:hypothetical protein
MYKLGNVILSGKIISKVLLVLVGLMWSFAELSFPQILGEMIVEEMEAPVNLINPYPDRAILVVYSDVAKLSFTTNNRGVIEAKEVSTGFWQVLLFPGTHIISYMSEGYKSVDDRIYIPAGKIGVRKVKVISKPGGGYGNLRIATVPSGAVLKFNDIPLKEKTPVILNNQPIGSHKLSFSAPGYFDLDTFVVVKKDRTIDYSFTLNKIHYEPLSFIGTFDTPGFALSLAISGDFAYIADGKAGLRIINISNPARPFEVAVMELKGYLQYITLAGNCAYIADKEFGLYIVNVSDPAKPYVVGSYSALGYPNSVYVTGKYAYMANDYGGMKVIKLDDPSKLEEECTLKTQGYTSDIIIDKQMAFIADGKAGLWIANIADLKNIFKIGYCELQGYAYDVELSENCAYVACGKSGLKVVNIFTPGNPYEIGEFNTSGYAWDVAIVNNRAYIADGKAGLRVLDISDPASPFEIGYCDTPGEARTVAIAGDFAYVADGEAGMQIIYLGD